GRAQEWIRRPRPVREAPVSSARLERRLAVGAEQPARESQPHRALVEGELAERLREHAGLRRDPQARLRERTRQRRRVGTGEAEPVGDVLKRRHRLAWYAKQMA